MISGTEIEGFHAVISFGPDINLFRGKFIDLNGGSQGKARVRWPLDHVALWSRDVGMSGRSGLRYTTPCPRRTRPGATQIQVPPDLHALVAPVANRKAAGV